MAARDALEYPEQERQWLEGYMPPPDPLPDTTVPFVTLTFATSLDSALSLAPGVQTALSGPQSKAMTHYLRSRHHAILIGVGTALADNPSLNCRLAGVGGYGGEGLSGQPRPVVVDPDLRWEVASSKVLDLARQGRGRAPWIVCRQDPGSAHREALEEAGGQYIVMQPSSSRQCNRISWIDILKTLKSLGTDSVMIEGGATVINTLLVDRDVIVDSIIITIAPTWLGPQGAVVSPEHPDPQERGTRSVARLSSPRWHQLGDDVVLCGRMSRSDK